MDHLNNSKRGVEDNDDDNDNDGDQQRSIKKLKHVTEEIEDRDIEKKEPTVSDKYNSDDADITLISSDNVAFKVHSYQMMAASTVFRSMFLMSKPVASNKRDHIELTDPFLEHSWVLEPLLGIVYTVNMDFLPDASRARMVLDLAEKWDFANVRVSIKAAISRSIYGHSLADRLELSLQSKDPSLAASWIRKYGMTWSAPSGDRSSHIRPFPTTFIGGTSHEAAAGLQNSMEVTGGRIFDLGTWRYSRFLKMDPTVVWALLRAMHVGTTQLAEVDFKVVAKEYERLLKLAYEPEVDEVAKAKD